MCDCIKNKQDNIVQRGDYNGKKILSAEIQNVVFPLNNLKIVGMITTSPLDITIEGRKTKLKISLQHTYCPWCGVNYRTEEKTATQDSSKS
jgi:hypothetical protein